MKATRRLCTLLVSVILSTTATGILEAQPGAALGGLLANATDINFYGQLSGAPHADLMPSRGQGAFGVGFEFSFALPGGVRQKPGPKPPPDPNSCAQRHERNELPVDQACSDTIPSRYARDVSSGTTTYKDSLSVREYNPWRPDTLFQFELAVGFSQQGSFRSRDPRNSIYASLRELPSVTVYANLYKRIPVLTTLLLESAPYGGVRSGIVSLVSGRAYSDTAVYKLGGDTFQLGPVLGVVNDRLGVNLFAEGSYMWRAFGSVDWDAPKAGLPATYPRSVNLSGWSVAFGAQFELKDHKGK